jgi:hypothetical protein
MINFEKELKEVLEKNGDFNAAENEKSRKEIIQMRFDKSLQRTKLIFWIFFLLSLGMMAGGYIGLRLAGNTKDMLSWVIFFMIGFNSTILMKLWYWIVNTRINLQKELKELQLQISEFNTGGKQVGN